jgi:leucyl aminopeptidase
VVKLDRKADAATARKAGAAIGRAAGGKAVTVLPGAAKGLGDIALGALLRAYAFTDHKTARTIRPKGAGGSPSWWRTSRRPRPRRRMGLRPGRGRVPHPRSGERARERADHDRVRGPARGAARPRGEGHGARGGRAGRTGDADAPGRGAGVGEPLEGRGDGMGGRRRGEAARARRQGGRVRHRRHQPQARRRHGGHDHGHGRRGRRRGRDEDAGAAQGAKANVVGLVGLVENMPDGKAQRPGDVVRR